MDSGAADWCDIFLFLSPRETGRKCVFVWMYWTNNRAFDGCSPAGDGNVDAGFLAERKNAPLADDIVIMGLVIINCSGINQLGQALIPVNGPAQHWSLLILTARIVSRKYAHEIVFRRSRLFFRHSCGVTQSCRPYRPYYFCGFCIPPRVTLAHPGLLDIIEWLDDRAIDRFASGCCWRY